MTREPDKALDALFLLSHFSKSIVRATTHNEQMEGHYEVVRDEITSLRAEVERLRTQGFLHLSNYQDAKTEVSRLTAELEAAREALMTVLASLAAAVSLLERSPKTAAPSNKMFDQMVSDYKGALENGRKYFAAHTLEK